MAIAPVIKATLFGAVDQKELVLDGLQNLGCMHVIDLREKREVVSPARPDISAETYDAVKFLRTCPTQRRPIKNHPEFQLECVVQEALQNERRQQELKAERDELVIAIRDLLPWGTFRFPKTREFGDLLLWFYAMPHYKLRSLETRDEIWKVVSQDHRFAYVVILSDVEPQDMPVPRAKLCERPLAELQQRLDEVESELEELYWERVALTRWNQLLTRTIDRALDLAARQSASEKLWRDRNVIVIQGWVPRDAVESLREFAGIHTLVLTEELPEPDESPPTLLENQGITAGGQDSVTFYTTPAYRAWDPSSVVFFSFSVFFAMIMSDAGYALVLMTVLLFLWRRMGRSRQGTRLRVQVLAIAVASLAYGVAIGSYFGMPPSPDSGLRRLHVIDAADTTLMMQISIAVGTLHLVIANLALAISRRWSLTMLSPVGWMAILTGGLIVGLCASGSEPRESAVRSAGWVVASGFLAVLLFSSDRPLWTLSWRQHGGRILDGLRSLTGVTRAFGDVLSYLRLFALGLASAQLAATFNDLTYQASCCIGVGSLLAVLVVILGHGLNFALAIMSGVVHGLRLNCIEFFGWSLPDEGYPFEPFCKKAV